MRGSVVLAAVLSGLVVSPVRAERPIGPITLHGISGINPYSSIGAIRRAWGLRFPVIDSPQTYLQSEDNAEAVICRGRMRIYLHFTTEGTVTVLFEGAGTTDAGVGMGSSLRDLRRAYGGLLVPVRDLSTGATIAYDVVKPRARKDLHQAIEFTLSHGRVDSILWGRLADIHAVWKTVSLMC